MSITLIIIIITALISYFALQNRSILDKFMLYPYQNYRNKNYVTVITSGFLHADFGHLLFNMFTLYFFGEYCEQIFQTNYGQLAGSILYLVFYLVAIIVANIPATAKQKDNPSYRALGASGAVSAVLFSFIIADPWSLIYVYFIPVPAIIFGVIYLIYSNYMAKKGNDNIGHEAHFTGAIFGVLSMLILFPDIRNTFIEKLLSFNF